MNISDYKIIYNLSDWERIAKTSGELCAPIGAVRAVNALCDDIECNREAIAELVAALTGVIRVSDRQTDVFGAARAAIAKHTQTTTKKGSN